MYIHSSCFCLTILYGLAPFPPSLYMYLYKKGADISLSLTLLNRSSKIRIVTKSQIRMAHRVLVLL